VYHWKHGRKGLGVFWLQQARDEFLLNKIAQRLFDSVGKSISGESFKVVVIAIIDLISQPMLNYLSYNNNNNNDLGNFFFHIVCLYSNGRV
jgi:hypothetical protein